MTISALPRVAFIAFIAKTAKAIWRKLSCDHKLPSGASAFKAEDEHALSFTCSKCDATSHRF